MYHQYQKIAILSKNSNAQRDGPKILQQTPQLFRHKNFETLNKVAFDQCSPETK